MGGSREGFPSFSVGVRLNAQYNEYEYLLSTIYMELGFRAGIAFMMDLQAPAMKEESDQ